jgi:hypothetical protein
MATRDAYFGKVSLIPPLRVYARACVQLGLVYRAWLERNQPQESDIEKLTKWVSKSASVELTQHELNVIATKPGKLSRQHYLDCGWAAEALSVLSWALGCVDMPAPDEQSEMQSSVLDALGFLQETPATIPPIKRSIEEVIELTTLERLILWRLRDLDEGNQLVDMQTLASAAGIGVPPSNLTDTLDLAYQGQPIAQCDQSKLSTFRSITTERYRAAAWLLGVHAEFSSVPLDT